MASFKDCTTWLEKALKLQEKMLGDSISYTSFILLKHTLLFALVSLGLFCHSVCKLSLVTGISKAKIFVLFSAEVLIHPNVFLFPYLHNSLNLPI